METKSIWHLGAFNRNYGDWVIHESIQHHLQQSVGRPLDFITIDSQRTAWDQTMVDNLNRTASMLVVGGGGLVFNRPEDSSVSGWQFNISIENLERIEVPLVVYGIGWNEFPHGDQLPWHSRKHLLATQRKAQLFSVRDSGTLNELIHCGLSRCPVVMDAAAFCPMEDPHLDLPWENTIGLNLAGDRLLHRHEGMTQCFDWHNVMVDSLRTTIDQTDATVLFIPHVEGDGHLYSMFKGALGDHLVDLRELRPDLYPPSPKGVREFVGVYARVKMVAGVRSHSLVIPWGKGVPFMNFGTLEKNRWFIADSKAKLLRDYRKDFDEWNHQVSALIQ